MRNKVLAIILFLVAAVGFRLDAAFNITGVEYLKGEDFVQLHFPTDKLIPIPDLFYPDENDPTHIVMRVSEVEFKAGKDSYVFDSPVVEQVVVKKSDKYVDIDIKLRDRANYRVFTNQKGLYVEFPMFQKTASKSESKTPDTPKTSVKPVATSAPATIPAPVATPAASQSPKVSLAPAKPGKGVTIDNFEMVEQDANHVLFMCTLSGPAEYAVLPIPNAPVRLAVDLKNTRARSMNQAVDVLNVKKVRGALNTDNIYRIVFDLHYLKNYNVTLVDDNKLFIEFFNEKSARERKPAGDSFAKNDNAGKKTAPVPPAPLTAENDTPANSSPSTPDMEPPAENTDDASTPQPEKSSTAQHKDKAAPRKNNPSPTSETPSKGEIWYNGKLVEPQKEKIAIINSQPIQNETAPDFFADERSQSAGESLKKDDKAEAADREEQLTYLRRTIKTGKRNYTGELVDFNFKNADLENVLLFFAQVSGLSIIIDPNVKGTVTARMYGIPWDQALEYFLKVNNLDMVLEGNLLRVGRMAILLKEANDRIALEKSKEETGEMVTNIRTLSFASAADLQKLITGAEYLTARGSIMIDSRSNSLIITDLPERLELIDKMIDSLDTANPQVSIEARIVESNANYTRNLGIQWGFNGVADAMYGNQTSLRFPNSVLVDGSQITSKQSPLVGPLQGYAVNLPAAGATSGVTFSVANAANTFRLDMALSAMQSEGQGRIISSPKTTTHNNKPAKVMQGKQIPVQTIQNNTVTTQYIPAALELNVTPQITARGTIIVTVDIKNNSPDFGNLVQGIPPITTQTLNTTVMVEDGGTVVIGGIYRVEDATTQESTPFLSKLPILGSLFRNSSRRSEQKELLIFLTPRIIK